MHDIGNLGYEVSCTSDFQGGDSVTTQTGALGRKDCPITIISENKRFSSFLANGPIKFKYSTMQSLKTLKPFELT